MYNVNMGRKGAQPSRRPLNCAHSILALLAAGKGLQQCFGWPWVLALQRWGTGAQEQLQLRNFRHFLAPQLQGSLLLASSMGNL